MRVFLTKCNTIELICYRYSDKIKRNRDFLLFFTFIDDYERILKEIGYCNGFMMKKCDFVFYMDNYKYAAEESEGG